MQKYVNPPYDDAQTAVRLADLIGSGSTSTVFRAARSTGANTEMVAVKIPNADVSLADELAALKRFAHPNIVGLIDEHLPSASPGPRTAVVLELCDSGTVEDLLLKRPMTPGEVHMVVTSMTAALSTIHAAGWIHGDVNPSNIGLRSVDLPCLIDFGACRPADVTPPRLGTDGYTSRTLASTPTLDVRGLIATALAALGPAGTHSVNRRLEELLLRCDQGEAVSLEAVVQTFDGVPIEHVQSSRAGAQHLYHSAGGPGRPRTRQFGPRPNEDPVPIATTEVSRTPLPRVASIAILALLIAFIGLDVIGSSSSAEALAEPPEPTATASELAAGTGRLSAEETLHRGDATWTETGSAMLLESRQLGRSFLAGQVGDLAAIGDWNCDGHTTLGVLRPTTGAWFVFDSWATDAVSTVEIVSAVGDGPIARLSVDVDVAGCARPVIDRAVSG